MFNEKLNFTLGSTTMQERQGRATAFSIAVSFSKLKLRASIK